MGISLDESELWSFVADAPTGMLTTLRRDGWPVTLPVWFVALDQRIYVPTYATLKKVARIERDPRASFLVEEGRAWTELRAVTMYVNAENLRDGPEFARALAAIDVKYPPEVALPAERLPERSRAFYGGERVIVRLTPVSTPISWDNSRLRLLPASA